LVSQSSQDKGHSKQKIILKKIVTVHVYSPIGMIKWIQKESEFCPNVAKIQQEMFDVIYQTRKTMFDHISKHWEESWEYDA